MCCLQLWKCVFCSVTILLLHQHFHSPSHSTSHRIIWKLTLINRVSPFYEMINDKSCNCKETLMSLSVSKHQTPDDLMPGEGVTISKLFCFPAAKPASFELQLYRSSVTSYHKLVFIVYTYTRSCLFI